MHEAIINRTITTKRFFSRSEVFKVSTLTDSSRAHRDIYYKDPALFVKQSVVDRYVDDIAFTFNVPRSALSVVRGCISPWIAYSDVCRQQQQKGYSQAWSSYGNVMGNAMMANRLKR